MTENKKSDGLKSEDRRRFMELTAKFGFTAAAIAMTTGVICSREATAAKASSEEKERKKAAKPTPETKKLMLQLLKDNNLL